jgi:hypothetical protein
MNLKQLLITMLLFLAVAISAQVPQMINYQAQILDPDTDQPVADDTYQITFKIYDTEAATTAIWTEMHQVQTQTGMYNVLLGLQYPITNEILTGSEKWLGVKVGADNEMLPRKRFTSVAYSLADNDWEFNGDDIFYGNGKVSIGEPIPTGMLHVTSVIEHGAPLILDRSQNDGTIAVFRRAGVTKGQISVSGETVIYSQFTGSHHSRFVDIKEPRMGMIVVLDRAELNNEFDNQPKHFVSLTTKVNDKRVFGIIGSEKPIANEEANSVGPEYLIFALGDGVALVTDVNGNIENGDYLTTSSRAGYAQKQNTSQMMNFTVAKSLENVDWSEIKIDTKLGFKWKLIAVTIHSG